MCCIGTKSRKREVMKMKKLIALLLAALMCLSLCACGKDDTPGETLSTQAPGGSIDSTAGNNESEQPGSNEETNAPTTAPSLTLSDDLADFTVSIDGTVYQFPCSVQTMLDDGWNTGFGDQIYTREVEPDGKTQFTVYRGDGEDRRSVFVDVYNPGTSARTINECMINIIVKEDEKTEVILAGDFKLSGSLTPVDIIAQYGEDYSLKQGIYTYRFDKGRYLFETEDGHLTYWQIIINESAVK